MTNSVKKKLSYSTLQISISCLTTYKTVCDIWDTRGVNEKKQVNSSKTYGSCLIRKISKRQRSAPFEYAFRLFLARAHRLPFSRNTIGRCGLSSLLSFFLLKKSNFCFNEKQKRVVRNLRFRSRDVAVATLCTASRRSRREIADHHWEQENQSCNPSFRRHNWSVEKNLLATEIWLSSRLSRLYFDFLSVCSLEISLFYKLTFNVRSRAFWYYALSRARRVVSRGLARARFELV